MDAKNKTAKNLFVRIPLWIDRKTVKILVNDKTQSLYWLGNYLAFEGLTKRDTVTIQFPMVERTEHVQGYIIKFKGNTAVDIIPRSHQGGYPIYRREFYQKSDITPMKKKIRYVTPRIIKW